jgi:hypothetical protein
MAEKKTGAPAPDINALAIAAGLNRAVKRFPQDVAAAAQAAASARAASGAINQGAAEPWPRMQVRDVI